MSKQVNKTKLDVGCWHKCPEDYDGLDIMDFGQKYVRDARDPLPLMDNGERWEQIRAHHFIEHLDEDEAMAFINDCHGKCEELYIITPHLGFDRSWYLTHKTHYTEETFKYYERDDIGETTDSKKWTIKRMVTNRRGDIHVWMKPRE